MSDYTVLGGHENAEFRRHDDGRIELYSTEETEDGEMGHIGDISADELREVADTLREIRDDGGADSEEAPTLDDMELAQHPLLGTLLFIATDEDGRDMDRGAAFGDIDVVIYAADALDDAGDEGETVDED